MLCRPNLLNDISTVNGRVLAGFRASERLEVRQASRYHSNDLVFAVHHACIFVRAERIRAAQSTGMRKLFLRQIALFLLPRDHIIREQLPAIYGTLYYPSYPIYIWSLTTYSCFAILAAYF